MAICNSIFSPKYQVLCKIRYPGQVDKVLDKVSAYNENNKAAFDCLHDFSEKGLFLNLHVQIRKNDIFLTPD